MILVEQITQFFGGKTVLHNLSFRLAEGEVVGLIGPSGSGKSVLLKILGNVIEPSSGSVVYGSEHQARETLTTGFLFQEGALFDSMTVLENVSFPILSADKRDNRTAVSDEEAYARSVEILDEVGLVKAQDKLPGQLSGGMRRRVALARALVNRPELVLLDDPTGGLDPVAASVIMNLIRDLHQHYRPTVVMVSHDIRRLLPNVTRVIGLFDGSILCDETPAELPRKAPRKVVEFLATRYDFPDDTLAGANA